MPLALRGGRDVPRPWVFGPFPPRASQCRWGSGRGAEGRGRARSQHGRGGIPPRPAGRHDQKCAGRRDGGLRRELGLPVLRPTSGGDGRLLPPPPEEVEDLPPFSLPEAGGRGRKKKKKKKRPADPSAPPAPQYADYVGPGPRGGPSGSAPSGPRLRDRGALRAAAVSGRMPPPPPPPAVAADRPGETWATVVRRGAARGSGGRGGVAGSAPPPPPAPRPEGRRKGGGGPPPPRVAARGPPRRAAGRAGPERAPAKTAPVPPPRTRKPPRTAAVVVTCEEGGYEKLMREAQSKVDLASLGIEGLRVRRTLTGALAYEVPGEGGAAKADKLASGLRDAVGERPGVKISRPVKLAEVRVLGLDVSTDPEALAGALSAAGECAVGEVRVGPIRPGPSGASSAWARCPLVAANRMVAAGGRVRVGWVWARVSLLEERPLQCYKCMEGGHVRAQCPNDADRAGRCYRCGAPGHLARDCQSAQAHCVVCADKGRKADHRAGGRACPEAKRRRRARLGAAGGSRPPASIPGPRPCVPKEGEVGAGTPAPVPRPLSPVAMETEGGARKATPSSPPSPEAKRRRKDGEGSAMAAPSPAEIRGEGAASRSA